MQELGHRFREVLEIRQSLDNRGLRSYTQQINLSIHSSSQSAKPTKSVTVMLDGNTKNLERMHADGHTLDPLLALEDEINRSREKIDKSIAVRRCQKDPAQLELHHFAHGLGRHLDLMRPIPGTILCASFGLARFPQTPARRDRFS